METARLIVPKKLTRLLHIGYIEQCVKCLVDLFKTKESAQFSID
jgi:hypothetical protein